MTGNMLYFSPGAPSDVNARLGFAAWVNGTHSAHDNYMVGGGDVLDVGYWQSPIVSSNTLVGSSAMVNVHDTATVGWQWAGKQ